jgi:hypothetical protein
MGVLSLARIRAGDTPETATERRAVAMTPV